MLLNLKLLEHYASQSFTDPLNFKSYSSKAINSRIDFIFTKKEISRRANHYIMKKINKILPIHKSHIDKFGMHRSKWYPYHQPINFYNTKIVFINRSAMYVPFKFLSRIIERLLNVTTFIVNRPGAPLCHQNTIMNLFPCNLYNDERYDIDCLYCYDITVQSQVYLTFGPLCFHTKGDTVVKSGLLTDFINDPNVCNSELDFTINQKIFHSMSEPFIKTAYHLHEAYQDRLNFVQTKVRRLNDTHRRENWSYSWECYNNTRDRFAIIRMLLIRHITADITYIEVLGIDLFGREDDTTCKIEEIKQYFCSEFHTTSKETLVRKAIDW